MEQEKEMDLAGFLMATIRMTDEALVDAKVAIIDIEDPNTYDVAINKIAYATGLIDLNQELIGYILDSGFEKMMSGIVKGWDSRLAFLEELLEEQKPSSSKSAEPDGKTEGSDSYKFISDVRVFKKSDVDVKPDVIIVANPDFYAKEASVDELARKIKEKLKKGIASKGE